MFSIHIFYIINKVTKCCFIFLDNKQGFVNGYFFYETLLFQVDKTNT